MGPWSIDSTASENSLASTPAVLSAMASTPASGPRPTATITSDADGCAEEVTAKLRAAGLRVETDLRKENVGYKVREHSVGKVPVIAVVGRQEAEDGKVAIHRLGPQAQTGVSVEEAIRMLTEEATPPGLKRGYAPPLDVGNEIAHPTKARRAFLFRPKMTLVRKRKFRR
ncbi:His/Gly/Thr/Pro-type tRNA ligase C-terminal domain-containing protein [Brevundimonas sp. NPDC092305]|uniref:His/Gly/Thr/Pro-type tRNA ligase C-terminal domain-containing protein n=1 Tax=Brevundimonas sp. NPDC092305 TaxID=3363957 RepID=UPI0037FEBDBE